MRKALALVGVGVLLGLAALALGQQDDFSREQQQLQERWQQGTQEAETAFLATEAAWKEMLAAQDEAWNRMVAEIERIWRDRLTTTKKEWVDYGDDFATRSYVNFEDGDMVVATMIRATERRLDELAKERIARQFSRAISADNPAGRPLLAGQIKDNRGREVNLSNLHPFLDREIFPRLRQKPEPIVGKDGVPRYQVFVPVKLIPNHTRVRAAPYIPAVRDQARRYGLPPELVMAVIHTESYFDPLARSQIPAYGLMQLVPQYGAREAYNYAYGQDRLLPPSYLYLPENNIFLGCTYLHLLLSKHFAAEPDPTKRLYLAICGYNWGPTAVQRRILSRHPTATMDAGELYQLLRQRAPQETSDYLQRVTERMPMYASLFRQG